MKSHRNVAAQGVLCLCVGLACLFTGCEKDDAAKRGRGHVPPEGLGAIIVENQVGGLRLTVAVNGEIQGRVRSYEFLTVDRTPGVYDVHLDYNNSSEEYDTFVTVVAGSNTIINIDGDTGDGDPDVEIYTLTPQ